MKVRDLINNQQAPLLFEEIVSDIKALGVESTDTILVHSSLSSMGWVAGGAQTVVNALLESVNEGTLVMPTHTPNNSDPANWSNPPVPESWWEGIRQTTPAFDPIKTPSSGMGAIPELFRIYPDVLRSDHPVCSYAAHGPMAEMLTKAVPFQPINGNDSVLDRLRTCESKILLLGATYYSNSTLHLAEHLADFTKVMIEEGCSMSVLGQRKWVRYKTYDSSTDDFCTIGNAFGQEFENQPEFYKRANVGQADCVLFDMKTLVEFATDWMTSSRN